MSIEVARQDYAFRPDKFFAHFQEQRDKAASKAEREEAGELVSEDDDVISNFSDEDPFAPSPYPPFFYRALHDMESMWWLVLYLLFRWIREDGPAKTLDTDAEARFQAQEDMQAKLFGKPCDRRSVLVEDGVLLAALHVLPPRLQRAGRILEKWRKQLVACYSTSEKNREAVTKPVLDGLYTGFAQSLRDMCEVLLSKDPDSSSMKTVSRSSRKRIAREDEDLDTEGPSIPPAKRIRA